MYTNVNLRSQFLPYTDTYQQITRHRHKNAFVLVYSAQGCLPDKAH